MAVWHPLKIPQQIESWMKERRKKEAIQFCVLETIAFLNDQNTHISLCLSEQTFTTQKETARSVKNVQPRCSTSSHFMLKISHAHKNAP